MESSAVSESVRPVPFTDARVMVFAGLIGIAGGLVATVYYYLLQFALNDVWQRLSHLAILELPIEPDCRPIILLVTTAGGSVVGLFTWWLGSAGEIAAVVDNIHLRHGRIDMRQTPSMVATSLVGISAGGSAGPEAPLVQIIGSLASKFGDWLRADGRMIRTFTFCGMGAALGAFFGTPLGGALFALEIPHRRGMEYYEALLPAIVSATTAFLVFRSIVGYEHILFHFENEQPLTLTHIWLSMIFGALGAGLAAVFALIFSATGNAMHRLHHRPILLATIGGLTIGLLAQLSPKSLFWGEYQIEAIIHAPTELLRHHTVLAAAGLLTLLGVVKMLAVGATLHSGFRGEFIFPLMFIGAAVGTGISLLLPNVPAAVIIVSMMAATNVAITKTPISTCIILATLTGTTMMPALVCASLVSLMLTTRVNVIRTQRKRAAEAAVATAV